MSARLVATACAAVLLSAAALASHMPAADTSPLQIRDDFERGLCTQACPGAAWYYSQQQSGTVAVVMAPLRPGLALRATAAAKADRVSKADLVAKVPPLRPGTVVAIGFDLFMPAATPRNSIQLVDLECATCGKGGNPGIRLYLRNGRLRIDRSKIGIAHAWTRDDAPLLAPDRWSHVLVTIRIGAGDDGAARVFLDGDEVLAARGATILQGYADRIQIGVTANSNPVPATLYIDNVVITARGPNGS